VLTNESKDREVKDIFKLPVAAPDVWQSPIVTNTLAQQFRYASAGVVHHRAATVGAITQRAAHPYRVVGKERTIWGAHNGSLHSYNLTQGTGKTAYATDSEWMFGQMADKGPAELKYVRGAFACVWLQSDDMDHVYFARNSERPLYYAFSDDQKIFIYGSEWKMLDWLATRNSINLHKDAEGFVWREFPKERLFTVNLDTLKG
jgi:predicted glutamine amidotransferase